MQLPVRDLVKALGGGTALAGTLGVTPAAISHWVAAGRIPPARETEVWRLAVTAGVDWSPPGAVGLTLAPKDAAA